MGHVLVARYGPGAMQSTLVVVASSPNVAELTGRTRFANVGRLSGRRERPASARAEVPIVERRVLGTICAFCFLSLCTHRQCDRGQISTSPILYRSRGHRGYPIVFSMVSSQVEKGSCCMPGGGFHERLEKLARQRVRWK